MRRAAEERGGGRGDGGAERMILADVTRTVD